MKRPVMFWMLLASTAAAHPMGNFSISRYSGITIERGAVELRYILDIAEIPTFQEMQQSGISGPDDVRLPAYLTAKSRELAQGLHLKVNGKAVTLRVVKQNVIFPPGAGNLPTIKLGFLYSAHMVKETCSTACLLDYKDENLPDSTGWKEIVIKAGREIKLASSTVPGRDRSGELSNYPSDLLNSPPQVLEAKAVFSLPAAPVVVAAEPKPLEPVAVPTIEPAKIDIVPNRQTTPRNAFTQLMTKDQVGIGFGLLAALIAAGLGALHALEPGHGKTIVAAYLVGSKGTARHAVLLGLIVTVSHTAGVFLLGGVTLYAQQYVLPERLYPLFGVLSGILIAGTGLYLFLQRYVGTEFSHDHGPPEHGYTVRPRMLLVLGITGGIVPCPAALVVLLSAVALHRVAFGLFLIVAFSAGLAAVLIAMGLVAIRARQAMKSVRLDGPLVQRWLPLGSAALVTLFGCTIAVQGAVQALCKG